MKLIQSEIQNFKSFEEKDNILFLDNVNVVVGKNESGKSNIIDALAGIDFVGLMEKEYFNQKNRKTGKDIMLKLLFENYPNEDFSGNTSLEIKSYGEYYISGAMSEYIKNNNKLNTLYNEIVELNESGLAFNKAVNQQRTDELIDMLSEIDSKIFVEPSYYKEFINTLKGSAPKHKELVAKIENMVFELDNVYCNFPHFIKVENKELKTKYTLTDIENDDLLEKLLDICDINIEELKARVASTDTSAIRNYERIINKKINDNFSAKFNNFYSQEDVVLEFAINTGNFSIIIDTTNNYLDYDERSNGLKWYLNLFIQLLYMERKNCESYKNNIILIDEPGVYLHANAQKELYSLFKDLTNNSNQIVFTTHSPFMLDNNELQNIRAIIKDENGFSHIYNKITTIPTQNKSTYDTITPLVYAMGMDLNYNIGPNFKKKNIIVEGISDYFYLNAYFNIKKTPKKDRPNIIPSTGADNILPISSILYGWGCEFIILLDQDDKGRAIYDKFNDKNHPFLEKILFVDGSNNKATIDFEIEDLFSLNDKNKLGLNNTDYDEKKYNYSYLIYNSVLQNEITFEQETINNFDKLNLIG